MTAGAPRWPRPARRCGRAAGGPSSPGTRTRGPGRAGPGATPQEWPTTAPAGGSPSAPRTRAARAWAGWTRRDSARRADDGAGGRFEWWYELTEVLGDGALVRSEVHYRFQSGEELMSENELRFRARPELARDLAEAGFEVERLYGDWERRPAGPGTRELIFVAVRG